MSVADMDNYILIKYGLKTGAGDVIFNIKKHDDMFINKSYHISNFYFIDNQIIILWGTSDKNYRFTYYNYEMNLDNNDLAKDMIKDYLKSKGR